MKKVVLLLVVIISNFAYSQVTTTPAVPIVTNEITIKFDATGTGLEGYTGDIYAHTGVTVNGERWQNVIESWGNNTTQPILTRDNVNANKYTLVISPNVYSFYGVATTETITELNFVFRSANASEQTADIFVSVYEAGLNIVFTQPLQNSVFDLNDNISITAESSLNADLELFVDNISKKTAANTTTITTSYTFTSTGNHTLKASATASAETKETEISVYVKTPTQNSTKPTGLKYGINKNPDNSVTFLLKAPDKNDVFVIGDFNNWTLNPNYQLLKDGDDFWLTISGLDANIEYAYQYLIDYDIKVADPYSEKILDPWNDQYISNANYPNLKEYPTNLTSGYVSTFKINAETYNWNVSDFTKPSQDNLIIYELHIRDFTVSDSFDEALTRLDYLQSLGINAIELMPVNEFEGNDSWGYNPALYMALDKAYGTKNDFKSFVDACHQRGIAVLADVVFNHSYGQSPLLQMYWNSIDNKPAADNPWYNENHNLVDNTSAHWGYDFNHESPHTVAFFNDVLSYWMTEYKIDGFRFDFTKGLSSTLYSGSNNWASAYDATRITILKNYADHVWNHDLSNKPYVIFEHLSENTEEKELANYGIMLWGNMNHSYNQNTMGYSSESNISWISYKQRGWNNANVVGYMESHDEERLMYKNLNFGNSSGNYNVKELNTALTRQEIAGMFFFSIPGPKMIWQFGELGYDFSIDENDRVGRKPIRWDYAENSNRKQIYNTWATLIEFKKQLPEVFNSNEFTLDVGGLTKSIVLKHASMDIVIIGNFDVTNKSITTNFTKTGTWYEYFTGEEKSVANTSESITLTPGEYRMYATQRLLDPRGGTASDDSDDDGVVDTNDLCPNTPAGDTVNASGCPLFVLPSTNFSIESTGETCPDKDNGQIAINTSETHPYKTTINGIAYNFTNSLTVTDLASGSYEFCITVVGEIYEQCYTIEVTGGTTVSGKASVTSKKATVEITEGTAPYFVLVNNTTVLQTESSVFSVDVNHGDTIVVKTDVACEGIFSQTIELFDAVQSYPNPTNGKIEIALPIIQKEVLIEVYNYNAKLLSTKRYPVVYGKVQINLENKPAGLYIAKVFLEKPISFKIIKQ